MTQGEKQKLTFSDTFCLRSALLPISFQKYLLNLDTLPENFLHEMWKDDFIRDAIFVASYDLYQSIDQVLQKKIKSSKRIEGLKLALYKYLIRGCSRATPFGLFSGVSLGNLDKENSIALKNSHKRVSRIDFEIIGKLCESVIIKSKFDPLSTYFINSSLNCIGEEYRYYEQYFTPSLKYKLSGFKRNEIFDSFFNFLENGKKGNTLLNFFINNGFGKDDASIFLQKLIDNNILISDLGLVISGEDSLNYLVERFKERGRNQEIRNILNSIKDDLCLLNMEQTSIIKSHENLDRILSNTQIKYNKKHLIQTDTFLETENALLSKKYGYQVSRALDFLKKILGANENKNIQNFKNKFLERYETEEIPLSLALDVDVGISYGDFSLAFGGKNILSDIKLSSKNNGNIQLEISQVQLFILRLISQATVSCTKEIILDLYIDQLYSFSQNDQDKLNGSFSSLIEILVEQNEELILLKQSGGSSSINLLSRFHHLNSQITEFVKQEGNFDEKYSNELLCEIIHLPENRVGNILHTPLLRKHEIRYLGLSSSQKEAISINDLMVSIKQDKIRLRSRKHNKVVRPVLSHAYNYRRSELPIFRFLCDLQATNNFSFSSLLQNSIFDNLIYIPRIRYQKIILQKARWNLSHKVIFNNILNSEKENKIDILKEYLQKLGANGIVELVEGDNILPINVSNKLGLSILISRLESRNRVVIHEHIRKSSIVKSSKGFHANEILLFYRMHQEK